jgi:hypothetical protein
MMPLSESFLHYCIGAGLILIFILCSFAMIAKVCSDDRRIYEEAFKNGYQMCQKIGSSGYHWRKSCPSF